MTSTALFRNLIFWLIHWNITSHRPKQLVIDSVNDDDSYLYLAEE